MYYKEFNYHIKKTDSFIDMIHYAWCCKGNVLASGFIEFLHFEFQYRPRWMFHKPKVLHTVTKIESCTHFSLPYTYFFDCKIKFFPCYSIKDTLISRSSPPWFHFGSLLYYLVEKACSLLPSPPVLLHITMFMYTDCRFALSWSSACWLPLLNSSFLAYIFYSFLKL
jgi:hypothetical protein